MQMQKRKFRIGDLAKKLNVDKFVIRFWEKEFTLNSDRSDGGQRFYEEKDFEKFRQIKTLLYEKKFTIAGAKRQLKEGIKNENNIIASQKTDILDELENTQSFNITNTKNKQCSKLDNKLLKKVVDLRRNLIKLRELLS
jgi:DNA-binding transcriptional MerR regulator